jgi:TPP-dependent pyruvate/acetoin dehydrogenase alpha subunit
MSEWHDKDCIVRYEKLLLERGVLSPERVETIRDEVEGQIEAAVQAGREAPFPDVSEVTEHVYA